MRTGSNDGATPEHGQPTLVVDANGSGDFRTLTHALRAAQPGSRILVRPAKYKESVLVEKPVEIIGDGDRDDIVIEGHIGTAIAVTAENTWIANLTLRHVVRESTLYCLLFNRGEHVVENCDIACDDVSCVSIDGTAEVALRRSRIHSARECGVLVFDGGHGILEDNEIFANKSSGVSIVQKGTAFVRRTRIFDCQEFGIRIGNGSRAIVEDNEIFGNGYANIGIHAGGDGTIRGNRIYHSKQSGIFLYDEGRGTIRENKIFANGNSGISVTTGSRPQIVCNEIYENGGSGIRVRDTGYDLPAENGKSVGCRVDLPSDPVVTDNIIRANGEGGVYVHAGGRGTFQNNEIVGNTYDGVRVESKGGPTFRNNRIVENKLSGVSIDTAGGGTFEENDMRGNLNGAWDLTPEAEAHVARSGNLE